MNPQFLQQLVEILQPLQGIGELQQLLFLTQGKRQQLGESAADPAGIFIIGGGFV